MTSLRRWSRELFSTKSAMPSRSNRRGGATSKIMLLARSRSAPLSRKYFVTCSVAGLLASMTSTSASTSRSSTSGSQRRLMRLWRSATAALNMAPMRFHSLAFRRPANLAIFAVPPQPGRVRGHHEITRQGELKTAASTHTVHGSDRDGHQVVDHGHGVLIHPDLPNEILWCPVIELLHVVAGAKRVTGPPQDHDATLAVD